MSDRARPTQPVRAPTGGDYGARRQLEAAQGAVPLPDNRGGGGGGGVPAPGGGGGAPMARPDVFGPSQHPNEPITAGAPAGAGPDSPTRMIGDVAEDPGDLLRALYMRYPTPGVRRLLERAAQGRR